ncbi:MAG: hypothetical protein IH876_06245 [Gemmatimonadetes bacterium]|nr:hypothetical protein [Gemmatimonadota bacterium]
MIGRARDERGMVLMMAILAMVVMGGLVTAAFTTTWMEFRLAVNTRRAAQAFGAAEFGLAQTINNWNVGVWNNMDVLDSVAVSDSSSYGHGRYSGYVIRMAQDLFLVDVTGSGRGGLSQQRVGEYVRLSAVQVDIQAALTVQGPTTIGGAAQVVGTDSVPSGSGWSDCPPPDSAQSGIRMPDSSQLTTQGGCSDASCITSVEEDSTVADSTFSVFGDIDWGELAAYADTLTPGTYSGIDPVFDGSGNCNTSVQTNWGDPLNTSACTDYFRLMYVPGNLKLTGNVGQGMLLVQGNLEVSGGFEFYGVVIVRGRLSSTGTGGHFNGAVMAQNVDLDDNKILGSALVQYSSCSNNKALKAASVAHRFPSRGFVYR